MDHDRPAGARRERGLERGRVRHPRRQEAVGIEVRLVDRVRVHGREIAVAGDHVGPARTPAPLLAGGPDRDERAGVDGPDRVDEGRRPGPRVVVRRVAEEPEGRLVSQVPGEDRGVVPPAPGQVGYLGGLEANHLRVAVRVAALPPRDVPVGVPDLAPDEQGRVEEEPMATRRGQHPVQHREVRLVVAARLGLDRRPEEVDPSGIEADGGHLG